MKKLIVVAIVVMVCLTGCTLSGLNVKVDDETIEVVVPVKDVVETE
jgi:hypothetical protein